MYGMVLVGATTVILTKGEKICLLLDIVWTADSA